MIKKFISLILTVLFLTGVAITPLKADTNFAIGIIGNTSTFDTTGTEDEGWGAGGSAGKAIETTSASISKDVEFGSIFAEVVGRDGWAGMTVGLEYIPGEAELGAKSRTDSDGDTSDDADTGVYTGKAEISDHISFYLEPTIYPTENIGIYVKGGVTRVTVKSLETLQSQSTYGDVDVWGGSVGAGLRLATNIGFLVKLEYLSTQYEEVELTSSTGNKNRIKAEPEQEAARIAIGWQF